MEHVPMSPFGAKGLSRAMLAAQATAKSCPETARADKWKVLRDLTESKDSFLLTDRAVTVLSALLSFLPETEIGGGSLVVFPSNRELCRRAHGISEATLRRCLTLLVNAGLIVRRDSPNGKRYARKTAGGEIERAFGFDLKALLARADEIAAAAEAARQARREWLAVRETVSLLRRDIARVLQLIREEAGSGASAGLELEATRLCEARTRAMTAEDLAGLAFAMGRLLAEADKMLASLTKEQETDGSPGQNGRHKQDSNQTPLFESEANETGDSGAHPGKAHIEITTWQSSAADAAFAAEWPNAVSAARPPRAGLAQPETLQRANDPDPGIPRRDLDRLDLGLILKACPDIAAFARHGIGSWADLAQAASRARTALGISPDAWDRAQQAMGAGGAAVTIAAILQRAATVKSPGGYLRALTARAEAGTFTPAPAVLALLRHEGTG